MNVALVINPVSGGGKGKKVGQRFVRELGQSGVHFTIIQEESAQQTIATLNRIHEKDAFSSIVSVGGDGQAHLLFPFAIDWKVPILVVPAGTGNDFARSAGTFGKNASQLVEALTRTTPTRIDMGKVVRGEEITWFGQVLSTGFDSLVNERANRYKFFKGKIKYVIATARELPFLCHEHTPLNWTKLLLNPEQCLLPLQTERVTAGECSYVLKRNLRMDCSTFSS